MKHSFVLVLAITTIWIVMAFFGNPALAADDTEEANITVNIATVTMVNINPAVLSWSGLQPGSVGDSSDEAGGYFAVQIENIGSHNITAVWFNTTYPSSNPFGTANPNAYDAGNFVVIARDSTNGTATTNSTCAAATYYFVNRVEYVERNNLVYITDPDGSMPPNSTKYPYGRFRNTSLEYFWMIDDNTTAGCGGKNILIGNTPHTETQTGTVNFQTGSFTTVSLQDSSQAGWCYGNITTGPLDGYKVAVDNATKSKVMFSYWNADSPAGGTTFLSGENLVPGDSRAACIRVYVPYGVYEGQVGQGLLTVLVQGA